MNFHSMSSQDAANILQTDLKKGLTRSQILKKTNQFGKNELIKKPITVTKNEESPESAFAETGDS